MNKEISCLIASILATNINAMGHDGFKIISKTVSHINYIPTFQPKLQLNGDVSVDCVPYAYAVTGTAETLTTAKGKANYNITNVSTSTKNFVIDEYMCIDNFGCTLTEYHGTLAPDNTGNGLDPIEHSETINATGYYTDRAILDISGDGSCHVEVTNTVTIK